MLSRLKKSRQQTERLVLCLDPAEEIAVSAAGVRSSRKVEFLVHSDYRDLAQLLSDHTLQTAESIDVVLMPDAYQSFLVPYSDLTGSDLAGYLKWQVAEQIGGEIDNFTLDHYYLPAINREKTTAFQVCAVPTDLLIGINEAVNEHFKQLPSVSVAETRLPFTLKEMNPEAACVHVMLHTGQVFLACSYKGEVLATLPSPAKYGIDADASMGASRIIRDCNTLINFMRSHYPDVTVGHWSYHVSQSRYREHFISVLSAMAESNLPLALVPALPHNLLALHIAEQALQIS